MAYNLRAINEEMSNVVDLLKEEFSKLRTGRANTSVVEDIKVPYYGTDTPMNQMGSISIQEGNLIIVQPWDKNAIGDIENAIRNSDKGLSPTNDGRVVRISLPPLNEERRSELVRLAQRQTEEARVALRNIRHKHWEALLKEVKAGTATEDDKYRVEKELNDAIAKINQQIEEILKSKETEIKTV